MGVPLDLSVPGVLVLAVSNILYPEWKDGGLSQIGSCIAPPSIKPLLQLCVKIIKIQIYIEKYFSLFIFFTIYIFIFAWLILAALVSLSNDSLMLILFDWRLDFIRH